MNLTSSLVASGQGSEAIEASVDYAMQASGAFTWMWLLIAFPLFGAAFLLLAGRRTNSWGHWLSVGMAVASFVTAVVLFFAMIGSPDADRSQTLHLWDWIMVGRFEVPIALHLDQLSMTFVLLITGVGSLIHIYAVGYMEHDPERRRFFAYLNLFISAMLLLVLADSYLVLYFGWEGVGLASYLLISFWQFKPSAAVGGKKAFIVNRVGDVGMSIAIMLMFVTFGSVTFEGVLGDVSGASEGTLTWIGLALLLAACGKSAQFPLQSWLLDAMEGPTPVSALIHAATMVTAGVYLIVRSGPIFEGAPTAATAVIVIGAITLIMGAIIGCAKDDIKKVLAGSTMSQIGYMMLAAGLGPIGYVFAIFHLVAHGAFKANMFLGAGSIMHGMHDQVDMRRFGALRFVMVATFVTFSAGWLAIMGIPPFAGFFSKDKIIEAAFMHGWIPGLVAAIGAGITAFYMTRLWTMTFTGKARWTEDNAHPHESPKIMLVPMAILAFLSVTIGFVLAYGDAIINWLTPVTGFAEQQTVLNHYVIEYGTLAMVIAGAVIAYMQYRREVPLTAPQHVSFATTAARKDLYGDAFNEAVFMRPGQWLTRASVFFDNRVIDGMVNGIAAVTGGLSGRLRRLQTGYVRSYGLWMMIGALVLLGYLVLVRV